MRMLPIRNRKVVLQACLYLGVVVLVLYLFRSHASSTSHNIAHSFNINALHSKVRYFDLCFESGLKRSIGQLDVNLQAWSQAIDRKCQILYGKYQDMYSVSVRRGKLHLPPKFQNTVLKWLGNSPELLKRVNDQTVFHVRNLYSLEHTVYNPLRAMRPSSSSGNVDPKMYVNNLAAKTNTTCDFCNFREMTAEDVFERVVGKHSVSAANTFKLDEWHGLILTKKHNPIDLNLEDVLDLFNTSLKWFQKVHSIDPEAKYPNLIWDSLPHAGASQVHPHVHGMMDPSQYYGAHHIQQEAARRYHQYTGNRYWDDLIEIHHALGLTVTLRSAVAVAPLTSKKDHEFFLLSSEPTSDLFVLLHQVIQTYYHTLSIYCFSTGLAFPPAETLASGSPTVIRIGTRGDCSSVHSDISSLELYSVNNVNVDPYKTVKALQERVDAFLTSKQASTNYKMMPWP